MSNPHHVSRCFIAFLCVLAASPLPAYDKTINSARTVDEIVADMQTLKNAMKELKERDEVRDVIMRYGRGIDRLDEKMYRSSFWPDARIGYGTKESISPEEHWNVHMMKWHQEGLKAWGHLLASETIDISGDVAHVETYVVSMPMSKDEGPGILWGGRYIDRVDRRNGEWRIAAREFVPFFAMKTDKNYRWLDGYTSSDSECKGDAWSWRGKRDARYVRPLPARTTKETGTPCAK